MKLRQVALIGAAMLLCSCASAGYERYQDEESQHRPYNCAGYHVSHASWDFNDQYGQQVHVTGKCSKGMKHGTFDFYVDGFRVARTKYARDEEIKTACYAAGSQSTMPLSYCMQSHVEKTRGLRKKESAQPQKPKSVWD